MNKRQKNPILIILIFIFAFPFFLFLLGAFFAIFSGESIYKDDYFKLLTNEENREFIYLLSDYAKENNIKLLPHYVDDIEAIELLKDEYSDYDAVWLSNSTWLYMASDVKILNSKSTNINPVVFGIRKRKAQELGFINRDVYNKDIVNAIKDKKLNYVMSSVTKTNTGLIAYLGFLNSLSGSPEILTSDMLKNKGLVNDLQTLFSGVQRVSGSDDFLREMFLNSYEYDAVVATESSLIQINKDLEIQNKEPLYLIYPKDGVAINDSPFAYIDRNQDKLDDFNKLQSFILSRESQKKLESLGKRTWYGGINNNADSSSFKKEWGIDTTKYLIPLKYPSANVIDEAIELYLDELRKPSATVFCLDYSGSMYGSGESELESAMEYILDYDEAKEDKIQFSPKDKIYVIPFNSEVKDPLSSHDARDTKELITQIKNQVPGGGTNIYGCASSAINLLQDVDSKYTKTVILMSDGEANVGTYSSFKETYDLSKEKIPVYSIMFGNARRSQLSDIAQLTNAKVFDGRYNLTDAFKEVRSYN